jgi:tripartite-type tricarboxylate transporter receptor subunit TctC
MKQTRSVKMLVVALVALLNLVYGTRAALAQTWPQRPVRLIVPLSTGSSVDVTARVYAARLASIWGQPVVVENLPGADGIVAVREFIGRRDDHTLLYSFAGPISINPVTYATLPYDPVHDLVPIAASSENCLAIAASPKLGVTSLPELLERMAQNGKSNWAATAGLTYFAFAGLLKMRGVESVHVPYRDFGQALVDLKEGRIGAVSTALTQMQPHAQAGNLKLLAVNNRVRCVSAPELPTMTELGYPDLAFDGVTGFFGRRAMPDELRQRIAADVRTVAAQAEVVAKFKEIGVVSRSGTPAQFAAEIEEQRAKVAKIAAAIGTLPAP